jgi:glycine dehydrogenase subunit 2
LIVHEALMIEPTETEPRAEMERMIEAFIRIYDEEPDLLKEAPRNVAVRRLDEVKAARKPILSWMMHKEAQKK